jgi:hypothetical protein
MFLVSVASKGLEFRVSALESTFTGTSISADFKGVSHLVAGPSVFENMR